jgi:hypothetical protein
MRYLTERFMQTVFLLVGFLSQVCYPLIGSRKLIR